jgi:AraC family transcriptional regulator
MRKNTANSTFGRITRHRELDGLNLYDVSLRSRMKLPFHIHRTAQMCIVLEGTYKEETRSQRRILTPGGVLMRPAEELHRNHVDSHNVRTLLVDFEPERSVSLQLNEFLAKPVYFRPGVLWNSVRGLETEMESMIAAEGIILLMVARATRMMKQAPQKKLPVWLEKANEIIHTCYREKIRLSRIASEVKVHPVSLATAFRVHFGRTIERSILQLRLIEARQLLLQSSLSLAEIADELGFFDQSHFGKAFKREFHVSPGAFRRLSILD